MATTRLSPVADYVERGYGQVEPNHLSAQRTGQIYAQLPAAQNITLLENGQFVKYDYSKGVVDFAGPGEWMLVFNEVKVYRDYESDNDFAMIKGNYTARVYSPVDADSLTKGQARNYSDFAQAGVAPDGTNKPFGVETYTGAKMMPEGTTMVPRVFKTNIGDIFTTNTIKVTDEENVETSIQVGKLLQVGDDGYLAPLDVVDEKTPMAWEIVKVYTMPDHQRGVKIMRIK